MSKIATPCDTQCRWTIGWKTPTLMVTSYLFACLVAAGHGFFYDHLSGQPADGPTARIPQTYSTTASVILTGIFAFLIRFTLGMAFTQYLWRILRLTPLRTATIDRMFTLRTNIFSLFDIDILKISWPLALSAAVLWSIPLAVSFPPGAMTVVSSTRDHIVPNAVVPTFNASDFKSRSWLDLLDNPLSTFYAENTTLSFGYPESYAFPPFQYLIERTLMTKSILDMPSPCGANCSYTLNFTGPYLQCKSTYHNTTLKSVEKDYSGPGYSGEFLIYIDTYKSHFDLRIADMPGSNALSHLHIHTTRPNGQLGLKAPDHADNVIIPNATAKLPLQEHRLDCLPSRIEYTVRTIYQNNIRTLDISTDPTSVRPLIPALSSIPVRKDLKTNTSATLDPSFIPILRDMNLYAIIRPMADLISGVFKSEVTTYLPATAIPSDRLQYYDIDSYYMGLNNTTIPTLSPLLQYFTSSNLLTSKGYSGAGGYFTVNETILNTMLQDIMLSAIPFQSIWKTHVNQTQNLAVNVYSFSKPKNLILPYALTLAAGLCILLLGLWALHTNGVSATDGGFLQLLTTTRGSVNLDKVIRGGCLGGAENVPIALKNLRIQYGELISDSNFGDKDALKAGFGLEGEVVPLDRNHVYG